MYDRHIHPLCSSCVQKPEGSLMCNKIVDCVVDHYSATASPGTDMKTGGVRIPETEIIRIAELKRFENKDDIEAGRKPRWKKLGER